MFCMLNAMPDARKRHPYVCRDQIQEAATKRYVECEPSEDDRDADVEHITEPV